MPKIILYRYFIHLRNLFKVLDTKKDGDLVEFTIELSDKKHPFFKAHFRNNEILAAFLQIDIISSLLGHKIKKINRAKFLSIIKPNEIIKYYIIKQNDTKYKITIKSFDNNKISEFIYEI